MPTACKTISCQGIARAYAYGWMMEPASETGTNYVTQTRLSQSKTHGLQKPKAQRFMHTCSTVMALNSMMRTLDTSHQIKIKRQLMFSKSRTHYGK